MSIRDAIRADPFRAGLILVLVLVGIGIFLFGDGQPAPDSGEPDVTFFHHPACPHCQEQKKFNRYLRARHPELRFLELDVSAPGNAERLAATLRQRGLPAETLSVPVTLIGPFTQIGFDAAATTGLRLERAVEAHLRHDPALLPPQEEGGDSTQAVTVPLLGPLRVSDYSLASLAVVLGLLDGFNPCAMWVLVYLLSLILALRDRTKIWLLVGSFLVASGVLYFLFLATWLNAFLLVGYLRPVTVAVGLTAFGFGLISLRDGLRPEEPACPVGDGVGRQRTMGRLERLVNAPLSWLSVLGIIGLALVVNSVEFACSAALPAVFTHTLSLRAMPGWRHYGYLLLYDLFYMLDDLIIFSLAVLALDTTLGSRYVRYGKLLGGVLLAGLGLVLVLRPAWLR